MTAMSSDIILADGKTTPTNHTFEAATKLPNGHAIYTNRALGFSEGREVADLNLVEKGKLRSVDVYLKCPRTIDETVNGVTVSRVVDFMSIKTAVNVPLAWDATLIQEKLGLGRSMLGHATFRAMVEDGEGLF